MILRCLDERREGVEQTDDVIRAFVDGLVDGSVTRAQAAAWLSFVYLKGMTDKETVSLTKAMTHSGDIMSWEGIEGPFVDKHSTGGVGDKVSLVLAPVWAALGYKVPMNSGSTIDIEIVVFQQPITSAFKLNHIRMRSLVDTNLLNK